MMSTFVFTGTAYRGNQKPIEKIWLFGFQSGDFTRAPLSSTEGSSWDSNAATTPSALTDIHDRAIGAMSLTIVVPVPFSSGLFTAKTNYDKFRIYATDKTEALSDWKYSYEFEDLTVVDTKVLQKGTFHLPTKLQFELLKMGSAAWLTPMAVQLFLSPDGQS
jgi:hypothetical protein